VDITKYLIDTSELIEEHLNRLVPEKEVPYRSLLRAARYALLGGGKRLRPILTIATTEAFKGCLDAAIAPACALEMIHTYSLIHDDLPCMDNDDFRRGKPSLHKAFPEGHAVLAGDFLLTHAFAVLAEAPGLSAEQKVSLVTILGKSAGGEGMIAGQILDIEAVGTEVDLDALQLIHQKKTGEMIVASVEFGGIISHATYEQMEILRKFGQEIGLAFQIVDDILDVTASQEKHGKAVASDVINDKSTYVTLLGLQKSQALAEKLFQSAIKRLDQLPINGALLTNLARLFVNRTH
jgi:geranylgeranyl diphosphate synthase type II